MELRKPVEARAISVY
jgi:hypothetical protein